MTGNELNYVAWRNVKEVLPIKEGKYYSKVAYTVVEGQNEDGTPKIKKVNGYGYELVEFHDNEWRMDNWVWEGCFSRKVVAWAEIPASNIILEVQ